jgi:hypothetical protein
VTDSVEPAPAEARDAAPTEAFVARLIPLDPGFYAFRLDTGAPIGTAEIGVALPAVHICAVPLADDASTTGLEITDERGDVTAWLDGRQRMLFVKAPAGGGAALVTAYLARDPDSGPLRLDIQRVDRSIADVAEREPGLRIELAGELVAATGRAVGLNVVAHVRGRGDVRFVDAEWIGRLGPGMWIEGLSILPRNRAVAAAVEYKGLTASGAETAWLPGGSFCGSRARGNPLIGVAVRQKAGPAEVQLDCEYSGYFRSGATAGPARNGAPCRSERDDDPLEGLQLRITPRPRR